MQSFGNQQSALIRDHWSEAINSFFLSNSFSIFP